jgi:hypothetical protein
VPTLYLMYLPLVDLQGVPRANLHLVLRELPRKRPASTTALITKRRLSRPLLSTEFKVHVRSLVSQALNRDTRRTWEGLEAEKPLDTINGSPYYPKHEPRLLHIHQTDDHPGPATTKKYQKLSIREQRSNI